MDEKKKIGILTFHNAHNYGAVLQAYALKTKLNRMGYKAKILNYQNPYIARLYRKGIHIDFWKRDILPSRWGKVFHEVGENLYGLREWKNQWTAFEKFIGEKLLDGQEKKLTLDDLAKEQCDVYILGSDQIWARELTHGFDPAYFGQFAPGCIDHPAVHRHHRRGHQRLELLLSGLTDDGRFPARQRLPAVRQHLRRVEEVVGVVLLHFQRSPDEDRGLLPFCAQRPGHPAALVVLDELAGQFLFHPLALFAAGQQQIALHLHQMRRHLDEGAGRLRVGSGVRRHRAGVLVDEFQNGDVVQVHLVLLHQRQQQFQRAFEVRQMEGQLFCHSDHRPDGCVIHGIGDLVDVAGAQIQQVPHGIVQQGERAVQKAAPDHRQHDDKDHPLIFHDAEVDALGQHRQQHPAAVQRRHRDEVEHRQTDIHHDQILQEVGCKHGSDRDRGPVIQQLPDHHREVSQEQVRHRACQRRERHARLGVLEIARVGGDRLCPAHARQHHAQGAHQVKVAERVQRQPALPPGRRVAQQPGGEGVARFVERDGDQRHQRPDKIVQSA